MLTLRSDISTTSTTAITTTTTILSTKCHFMSFCVHYTGQPVSILVWHCWLGCRKSMWPIKIDWWLMRCWHGYLSGARCKWFACSPSYATATPIISCFIKTQIDLTFLVLAYSSFLGKQVSIQAACVSRHPQLRTRGFCWSIVFTTHMSLLMATSIQSREKTLEFSSAMLLAPSSCH